MASQMLRIRRMRLEDIPFAIKLTNLEKWGVTRHDLTRIIRLDPKGSFIACLGARRVGMITTTSYRKKVAWIGNVVVKRKVRGKRIGQRLVEHALAYLHVSGIRCIGLYCFNENVAFYHKLGFVRDARFVRLHRKSRFHRNPLSRVPRPKNQTSLRNVLSVDKKAFGADRSRLLRLLVSDGNGIIVESAGKSFLLVKVYRDMYEFGPWIGKGDFADLEGEVIKHALREYGGMTIEASCLTSNRKVLALLRHVDFRVTSVGFRMWYGRGVKIGDDRANYLLGFLDKG